MGTIERGASAIFRSALLAAIEALSQDDVVRSSLGAEYADYKIQVKTDEWESYHNSVSQWELDHYLNVYYALSELTGAATAGCSSGCVCGAGQKYRSFFTAST